MLLNAGNSEPPVEFRLFPLGQVETTKGTFTLSPRDAASCVERQQTYGNDLSIDYGHGVFNEADGPPQRAAGWVGGLEARPDGLWAVRVTWTETAARMLRAREQRYFSPAFNVDDDGHITEILNVALTLMPATHHLTPLVASRLSGRTANPRKTSMEPKYIDASALAKLADDIEKMAEGEDKEKADLASLAERCRKLADSGETLAKLSESDSDEDKDKENAEKTSDTDDEKEEAKAASRIVAAARKVTGKTSPGEVIGALDALRQGETTLTKLTARVAELEGNEKRARVTAMVKLAATPGPDCRVTPPEVDDLIAQGMKDEDWLKGYLSRKSKIVAASQTHTPASKPDKAAKLAALSDDQKKVIAASGLTPEEFVDRLEKLPA